MFLSLSPDPLPGMMITESPAATETSPSQLLAPREVAGAEGGTVPCPRTPCPARGVLNLGHTRGSQCSPTASNIPLVRGPSAPPPRPPVYATSHPAPQSLSTSLLPPLDTDWDRLPGRGALLSPCPPSWMWLPCATCSSGSPHRVGQGCHCPLVHYVRRGSPPPASPALLPLSLVPAAPRAPILALCLPPPPPPPPTRGLRQRAGISCWCWAGDTQPRLLPICHPRGHLPLVSCYSAERHRDENPPTWQKARLNAGGWQK